MTSTHKRVEYALGYVALGLLNEASDELEAISFDDRFVPAVMAARVDLHMATKDWDVVVGFASRLAELEPDNAQAWISWAYALREMGLAGAARNVLIQVEDTHGKTNADIPYNLACYNCLLGDLKKATQYLATACRMDASYKQLALDDSDLKAMRDQIAAT